jgi:Peptidase family M23
VTDKRKSKIAAGCALVVTPPLVLGLIAMLALVAVLGGGGQQQNLAACNQSPALPAGALNGTALTQEQMRNAATIVGVGQRLGVPPRGWVVAIATALQESTLHNYDHGDRDSLGLFQQRPSQGWGTPAQVTNPTLAAEAFYGQARHTSNGGLTDIPGWEQMPVTVAAQAVQASALPSAYADHEAQAVSIVSRLAGGSGGTIPVSTSTTCVGATSCPPLDSPVERGLTPDALIVARCVQADFGPGLTLLGVGERSNVSDHPSGRAVDVMIPNWDSATGNETGWQIARWAQSNAQAMGVKYVIWDARIWSVARADEGWRAYGHPSGGTDPTSLHRDHVHISVYGNAAITPVAASGRWTNPVPSGYEHQDNFGECGSMWASCHTGDDLSTAIGTDVVAAAGGVVTSAGPAGDYGNLVVIAHPGGVDTYYAHLSAISVREGQQVQAGQRIGAVGATGNTTGPHLHYEVRTDDQPVDPVEFMANRGVRL